jgi:hypothetical protein
LILPPQLKNNKVVAIAAIILVFAMLFMSFNSLTTISFSTDTEIVEKDGYYTKIKGELIIDDEDDHCFATAWKSSDGSVKSEQIVWATKMYMWFSGSAWFGQNIVGYYVNPGNFFEYRYKVYINNVNVATFPASGYYSFTKAVTIELKDTWVPVQLEPGSYRVLGSNFGEITVELEAAFEMGHSDMWGWKIDYKQDFAKMSKDGAYLKSGVGIVEMGGALGDVIVEGTDATFFLQTGFTHGTGWDVFIYPPGDKPRVSYRGDGFGGQDGFYKTVKFKVPIGWFIPNGNNEVRIDLWNRLWSESQTTFFVIDKAELAPTLTSLTWNTDYVGGSPVIVNAVAEPNPTTLSPIIKFHIYAYFGAPGTLPGSGFATEFIINGVDYPATANAVQFTFTIPEGRGDTLSVKVVAIDATGRASDGQWKSMNVINTNDPNDTGGDQTGNPSYPFMWNIEAIIIAIIGILSIVGIFLLLPPMYPPDMKKIIIMTIIGIITAVLVYLAGTLQMPYVNGAVIQFIMGYLN